MGNKTLTRLAVGITFLAVAVLTGVGVSTNTFSNEGFMPHGHCYLWTPSLLWTMVTTDLLIGLAYVSISICLYILVRRIRLPFSAMFLAFGAFIGACGATHFMEIYNLWYPNYWLAAFVKVVTALASVATAIILFPLFPKIVQFAATAKVSEERKRQLELINKQLEEKTEELVLVNRELEAFSYSVSHDLRTPLRGIDGFSAALAADYSSILDANAHEYIAFIRSGAQRMGQTIDDLLKLSQITRTTMQSSPTNLSKIAQETFQSLKDKNPKASIEFSAQENLSALGDPGLLRLVLENLISNAWKFSAKKPDAKIEFGATQDQEKTIFFVRDNGVGFDMKYASKLFGAFQRLHSVEEFPGTGIGLATSKRIIDRHGGKIWADSKPGSGTTFHFTLGEG
jgi:signal transduction histidine kinase